MRFDGGDAENWLEGMNSVQLSKVGGGGFFFQAPSSVGRKRSLERGPLLLTHNGNNNGHVFAFAF